ncbi:MAG: hypothetical protein NDP13_03995 [Crenarchaeota archaeon]|nr:hypothetical protein [Thermoproteota archaeon]MCR8455514.1 hypothetical protein [Thermoproteota archaeon]MCR8463201.1 hypothetical protein [Thermoproteota archaeon]MCR8470868.1 hypothetical protein [Thermoproteota archaeon]MCR8471896.1 hypothetical protein [Thermoproteota archaeon]
MFTITVSRKVFEISKLLCRRIKKEWYAFALGKLLQSDHNPDFQIVDMYLPRQEASATHVYIPSEGMLEISDALVEIRKHNKNWILLGMWHSHGDLKCFHSRIDLENINMIYQSFPREYLPAVIEYERLGPEILNEYRAEPIIDKGLRGFKICFGSLCIELNLRQEIDDEVFFTTWYAHLYTIKALPEVLRGYFGTIPIFTTSIKVSRRCVVSVVVNNHDQIEGKVFLYGRNSDEVDAKIVIRDLDEDPIFANRELLNEILSKVKIA